MAQVLLRALTKLLEKVGIVDKDHVLESIKKVILLLRYTFKGELVDDGIHPMLNRERDDINYRCFLICSYISKVRIKLSELLLSK